MNPFTFSHTSMGTGIAPELDAPGFRPQRGPVTVEEFEKYLPRALAEKPRVESGENKKSKKISNKIYKITDNDVIYTLVTASRGKFKSFYSNKKTANAVTDPNRSSATGMLSKHDIPQNPENASGDLSENPDIRFSLADYSEEEQPDSIDILRPFVGTDINRKEELYRNYLKGKAIHIPDEDADAFFRMAVRENKNEALRSSGMKRRKLSEPDKRSITKPIAKISRTMTLLPYRNKTAETPVNPEFPPSAGVGFYMKITLQLWAFPQAKQVFLHSR